MTDTKENILHTALHLFARDGYEAVSVSAIAGALGITKGALYKHYKNKRDIFDCIVERMVCIDMERAKKYEVPEETFEKSPQAYRNTSLDKVQGFIKAQFHFWVEDEFACDFRKMLTLEQYRNPEMADWYQKVFAGGPVSYIEDVFRGMAAQGILAEHNPKQLTLEFYAPFYLLLSMADALPNKEAAVNLFETHIERFVRRYAVGESQNTGREK